MERNETINETITRLSRAFNLRKKLGFPDSIFELRAGLVTQRELSREELLHEVAAVYSPFEQRNAVWIDGVEVSTADVAAYLFVLGVKPEKPNC